MLKVAAGLTVVCALALSACGQSKEEKAQEDFKKALTEAGFTTAKEVPKETVKAWPAKFCSLSVGMTRQQVRAVMGEPTSTYNDSNANQDEWDGWGIELTAFYDVDDKVRQLDDSTGEANLPCEETRS